MNTPFDISIVIVNYKVKEYIANLLSSINKAKGELNLEIYVVDNNSEDDSIKYLKSNFPDVNYIENSENLGFGKANNQAIDLVSGEFTLIINPDTLVSEDTLENMVEHMRKNELCGACGCKILNPDGTFAPESKRAVPTLGTAISKVLGLNSIFPESRTFGKYYMGWIDEDETAKVPVLSGSFMFWRTKLLKQLKGFDERFFMYGEDIDLCYRVEDTEYYIEYVPITSIIHYKGESTRKGDLKYVRIFNKALYQFFEKHHSKNYSKLFQFLVFTAIWIRIIFSFIKNNLRSLRVLAIDLVLLNISVILGFMIRFNFSVEVLSNLQNLQYLWINVLASMFYIGISSVFDVFRNKQNSISDTLKVVFGSYLGIAVITFFVRNLAFSRLALIYGLVSAIILFLTYRLIQINRSKTGSKVTGKLKPTRILLVGSNSDADPIKQQIYSRPDWNYEIVGVISVDLKENQQAYLGSVNQLRDLVKAFNIDQVFFVLKSMTYKSMLQHISKLQNERAILKLIPDSMDYILGKSNVEYLEQIPIVDIELSYSREFNKWLKRMMDIFVSLPIVILLTPLIIIGLFRLKKVGKKVYPIELLEFNSENKWINRSLLFWNVLKGKLHLIGSSLGKKSNSTAMYKPGIIGYAQINEKRIKSDTDLENYELYYLQNYSIWFDLDILFKSFFTDYSVLSSLESESKS